MGRSLPHDIVGTVLDSLISPSAHTPITPSIASRQPPKVFVSSALPNDAFRTPRTLLPNLTPSNIVNPRHSIFLEVEWSTIGDTCMLRYDGHVYYRQNCPISQCLSLAVRPSVPTRVLIIPPLNNDGPKILPSRLSPTWASPIFGREKEQLASTKRACFTTLYATA